MATRSRTLLFLQYRNSFARSHSRSAATLATASVNTELVVLMESSDHIELSVLPPKWVDIVEEFDDDVEKIKENIAKLDAMHRKHLLPGFDDQTSDERAIERLTEDITSQFHEAQRKVQRVSNENRSNATASRQEILMSKNIQTSLATKLQEVSSGFRKKQAQYLQKLRGRENRKSDILGLEAGTSELLVDDDDVNMGFTESQMAQLESNEAAVSQREREVNEIARSITALAEIFRELQELVIDQGTLLDRIDYNIESTRVSMKVAVKELDQAETYQKKSRSRQCILLLIVLIFGLFIVLIFKPR